MILSSLRTHTLKHIIAAVILVVITGGIYWGTAMLAERKKEELRVIETEVLSTRSRIKMLETEKAAFEESNKLWTQLNLGTQSLEGIKVEDGRKVLSALQEYYRIKNLSIELTPPKKLEGDIYQTERFYVEGSIISLRFSAITDEYAISFINAVTQRMPGFVRVDQVTIRKSANVAPDLIKALKEGNDAVTVDVDVTFLWQGLKKEKEVAAPVVETPPQTEGEG